MTAVIVGLGATEFSKKAGRSELHFQPEALQLLIIGPPDFAHAALSQAFAQVVFAQQSWMYAHK